MKTTTTKISGSSSMMLWRRKSSNMKMKSAATERAVPAIWIGPPNNPIGAYFLFMRDFRKTEDCESAVQKAAAEKWASLTQPEKHAYELKVLERRARFMKFPEPSRKDADEDEAEPAASSRKSTREVDDAEEGCP